MPMRSCPFCARRLPYAGRRCVQCGWRAGSIPSEMGRRAAARRSRVRAFVMVAVVALVAQYAVRNADRLAAWYEGYASGIGSSTTSYFSADEIGADLFFFCARQVTRKMNGKFSVETYDPSQSKLVDLGDGRLRVESAVEEARQGGDSVRHDFSCTVRRDEGRWVLEELKVEAVLSPTSELARSDAQQED